MTQAQKNQIAQDFVDAHKNNNLDEWQVAGINKEQKLDSVYNNLVAGVYGNVEIDGNNGTIEIDKFDSRSGNPIIFDFEIEDIYA
ncbi:MAG: hypothetical protein ACRBG0_27570 [Lewinella sp.]|uniref:hypothetical protein n=1 Tax=Lewinella sp. TaxID=2004506 RepID=UPI003D6C6D0F